jgi:hypothetical protein
MNNELGYCLGLIANPNLTLNLEFVLAVET